jgi:hypothetical protein
MGGAPVRSPGPVFRNDPWPRRCVTRSRARAVYVTDMNRVLVLLALSGCAAAVTGCGATVRVSASNRVSATPSRLTEKATAKASTDCGAETKMYPQPPAGFDPTKATDAQLTEYGFPPRPPGDPSNPQVQAALQAWLTAMRSWKSTEPAQPMCGGPKHPPPPNVTARPQSNAAAAARGRISYRPFGVALGAPPANFSPRLTANGVLRLYEASFGPLSKRPVVALHLVRFRGRQFAAWVLTWHRTSPISYGPPGSTVPSTPVCDSVAVFDLHTSAWATRFQACPNP